MRDTVTSDEKVRIAFTLNHLPEHHRDLPHDRKKRRQGPDARGSQHIAFHAHTEYLTKRVALDKHKYNTRWTNWLSPTTPHP